MNTRTQNQLKNIFTVALLILLALILLGFINECKPQATQTIHLQKGWNLISSNVIPDTSDIEYIFRNVDVQLVTSLSGVYWKGNNINTIGNWKHNEGYKVKMNNSGDITLTGTASDLRQISLQAGVNYLVVPVYYNVSTTSIFEPVNASIFMVIDLTTLAIYMPQYDIDVLNYLKPGKAYIAYLFSPATINFK